MKRYTQLLCLIWFLLEVHFQTGNVLPHTQSLGMKLSISFIIILLPRSDIICECFGIHSRTHDPSSSLLYCPDSDVYTKFVSYQYHSQQYWLLSTPLSLHFVPGQCNFFNNPVLLVKLMQFSTIAIGGHRIEVYRRKC